MHNSAEDPFRILLIEDNPGDARLAQEALRDSSTRTELTVVADGIEALHYLRSQNGYRYRPRPHLILIDLNLPGKKGDEILQEIKSDPDLQRTPVIVLTTSTSQHDVRASYDNHANCYIIKPIELPRFAEVLRQIESFWFTVVTLPNGD